MSITRVSILALLFHCAFVQATPLPSLILEMNAASGYVPIEYRFQDHCEITSDGKLSAHTVFGSLPNGAPQIDVKVERTLSQTELAQVRTWIQDSLSATYQQRPLPCDIGTFALIAFENGQPRAITDLPDCGTSTESTSPSAPLLRAWLKAACQFHGR